MQRLRKCDKTIFLNPPQDFVYTPKLQKKAYDEFNRSATHFSRASLMKNGGVADQTVKVCKHETHIKAVI